MTDQDRVLLQTPEQWTRFLSAFVHELRTPLASLRMLADLLASAPDSHLANQERRYAASILEVVQDIQVLVSDVAEFGRLLAGRAPARPEDVLLRELVEQAEEAVRPKAWERGIALTDSLDPSLPRHFRTDPDRLRQVLTLLLSAVVSHAKSEVFFRLDLDGDGVRAVLSSDGPPFPETALQTMFEPFDDTLRTARVRGGRSLTLPVAHALTRVLVGTLRAGNRGGRPEFELWFPAIS